MKKHIPDLTIFAIIFLIMSDFAGSRISYDTGFFRYGAVIVFAVMGSMWFVLSHKGPIDHSWKGLFDVAVSVIGMGCVFLMMCLLEMWGFLKLDLLEDVNITGYNFRTTSWMIYFVASLLVRITLITEKLFHWWERRNIRLKRIE